jgi:hypothetical protein
MKTNVPTVIVEREATLDYMELITLLSLMKHLAGIVNAGGVSLSPMEHGQLFRLIDVLEAVTQ